MTDQGTQWWAKSNDSHHDTSMLAQADVKNPGCCALGPPPRRCAPTTPSHCALPATCLALTGCAHKLGHTLQSCPTSDRPSPWILSASSQGRSRTRLPIDSSFWLPQRLPPCLLGEQLVLGSHSPRVQEVAMLNLPTRSTQAARAPAPCS